LRARSGRLRVSFVSNVVGYQKRADYERCDDKNQVSKKVERQTWKFNITEHTPSCLENGNESPDGVAGITGGVAGI
jgi:hypothetical protein